MRHLILRLALGAIKQLLLTKRYGGNKENIDKFLESCENVISSSTHFNEESKIFEATIDVGKL